MSWGFSSHINYLKKLVVPNTIGNYNSFEVTEIVGFRQGQPSVNFLSLLVAEETHHPNVTPVPKFLNKNRLELGTPPWIVGIVRYRVSISQVITALGNLSTAGIWQLNKFPLDVGNLTPIPPQFVPANSVNSHPWNGVLKNNFWEGSYILELFDADKAHVEFLWREPKFLKELSEFIQPHTKMNIDGLADRLGSVLFQFPVTVVTTEMSRSENQNLHILPLWRPGVPARIVRITSERFEDSSIVYYGSQEVTDTPTNFQKDPNGGFRYVIWDDQKEVILGASAQTQLLNSIALKMTVKGLPFAVREFQLLKSDGTFEKITVPIRASAPETLIGKSAKNPLEPWRTNRIFRDSLHQIRNRKEFMQYGQSENNREQALSDIRWLIEKHGSNGAWLWDPYLTAADVLDTLLFCPHPNSDLRALTAGTVPPAFKDNNLLFHRIKRFTQKFYRFARLLICSQN